MFAVTIGKCMWYEIVEFIDNAKRKLAVGYQQPFSQVLMIQSSTATETCHQQISSQCVHKHERNNLTSSVCCTSKRTVTKSYEIMSQIFSNTTSNRNVVVKSWPSTAYKDDNHRWSRKHKSNTLSNQSKHLCMKYGIPHMVLADKLQIAPNTTSLVV